MFLQPQQNLFLFLTVVIGGVGLEKIISQTHFYLTKTHFRKDHFEFGRYIFLLFFPMLGALLMTFRIGWAIIQIFLIFAILGTIFEYFVGKAYHQIVGKRLWTYYQYSIGKYTSYLSVPIWGLGGVFFYLFAQVLAK